MGLATEEAGLNIGCVWRRRGPETGGMVSGTLSIALSCDIILTVLFALLLAARASESPGGSTLDDVRCLRGAARSRGRCEWLRLHRPRQPLSASNCQRAAVSQPLSASHGQCACELAIGLRQLLL